MKITIIVVLLVTGILVLNALVLRLLRGGHKADRA